MIIPTSTETVPCPACGAARFGYIVTRADGLNIVRCDLCGLAYVNPRPQEGEIQALYAHDYYDGSNEKVIGYAQYDRTPGVIRSTPPFDWTLLAQNVPLRGMRVLDVGCAFGSLVYWMKRAGANATGVDLSEDSTKWGRERLGLDLRCCALEQLDEAEQTFDAITMVDLIEHLPRLSGFLARVRALLKPGGKVFVRTPNFGCYPKYGDQCAFLRFSLEHLIYFEPTTLKNAFEAARLEASGDVRVLNLASARTSDAVAARKVRPPTWRRLARRLPFADLLRLIRSKFQSVPQVYQFDTTGKEGNAIVAFFRRPIEGSLHPAGTT